MFEIVESDLELETLKKNYNKVRERLSNEAISLSLSLDNIYVPLQNASISNWISHSSLSSRSLS